MTLKLSDAALCVQCDSLYPLGLPACPSCLSAVYIPLSRIVEPMEERIER